MESSNPAQSSPTPPTLEGLNRETDRLHRHLAQLRRSQSTGRWILAVTTFIVILQFAFFMWAMWRKLHSNFNHNAVQQAVTRNGDQILPLAQSLLIETGRDALPAYRDAFLAAIHSRGPELAKAAQDRFEQVPQASGQMMQKKLDTALDNVMQRIEPDFKTAFPNLADAKRQEMVKAFLADQIDQQNKKLADHITQLYTNDLIRMQAALDSFDLPPQTAPADDAELEHNVLHSMVMLLNDQVDAAYPANGAADDMATPAGLSPSTRPTTQPGSQALALPAPGAGQ